MIDTDRNPNAALDASAVSWAAILAGGVTAAALTVVLVVFGTAVGLASVSPWSNSGVSATTFKVTAGVYLVVVAMLSSTVGGYMAGRLRTKWTGAHSEEVLFRDTAHGFLAWGLATVLGVLVLGTATTSLLGGAASGLGAAARPGTSSTAPTDYFVDTLMRPAPGSPATTSPQNDFNTRREVNLIFTRGLAQPEGISAGDRAYLAQTVAARTGMSPADAEKRVNEMITAAKNYLDQARKFSSALALWLTLSMFAGAFAASAAAIEGGQLRDGRWRGIFARGAYR
jgi:hypothetical protein